MRRYIWLFISCLAAPALVNATTITAELSSVGVNAHDQQVFQYSYTVSGLTLQSMQELDFYFVPAYFSSLSDPVADSAFQTVLKQPDVPPRSPGDFGIVPNSDNTIVTGPLSVDFTTVSSSLPASQAYTITQFSPTGVALGVIAHGTVVPVSVQVIAEPATVTLAGLALLFSVFGRVARSRVVRRQDY